MIKALVFDFGNVFINLDIEGAQKLALEKFSMENLSEDILAFNSLYEQGLMSTEEFLASYQENFPQYSNEDLKYIWNFMLKDFPKHRLDFIKKLKDDGQFQLILLSNTNDLHISWIKENVSFFNEFKDCFDAFYLSHEINLVKPNPNIFEFVLKENQLEPNQCLFIDDNQSNIESANNLGFNTWHINPKTDDVTTLFETQKHLF
ncbi:HAD family hydrolase [Tamlana crocina]|uniref:HAD family phosphatase n=1 Tax=Tamlana crocina TaxID=393006 RepID=A0ABX1DCD5_9FLAO|nr:HAD family phosphatase [Tamlana crocina]NJX14977.1 HAD family phosphatase [Tamlana crocina]